LFIQIDHSLFYSINTGCRNVFLDFLMPFVSNLGDDRFLLAVAVVLILLRSKEVRRSGFLLLAGLITSALVVTVLKNGIARPRPFVVLQNVHLMLKVGGFSFPSGHAVNAFMAATLFVVFFRSKKIWYLYLVALGIAFSRVYLGVHFPSDVFAGALIGSLLGYGIAGLFNSLTRRTQ
jgi:undecaprenyl-diphosphatase